MLGVWAHPDDETYLTAGLMAQGVRDGGGAVVLVTQNVEDLERVADRVMLLIDGAVVFDGPVAEYEALE